MTSLTTTPFPAPLGRPIDLSIVVPAYNEEQVLPIFHQRLAAVLDGLGLVSEVIYINDGSRDKTVEVIQKMRETDDRVALVDLSRNFGKEIALTAGLDFAKGNWVVVIDADLQDPPELIPRFIEEARQGYDVVYAKRTAREGETAMKKATAYGFYRVMGFLSRVPIPQDTGDFRLLSRRAVDALKTLREHHRFMKGLFAWIGYKQKAVEYQRDARFAGTTKWNYLKLWNFAVTGVTSFTIAPLRLATLLGLVVAFMSFAYGVYFIIRTLILGNPVPGYPSLLVIMTMLGAVQLITLGIVGEYLGRMFDESKRRPLYLISTYEPPKVAEEPASGVDPRC